MVKVKRWKDLVGLISKDGKWKLRINEDFGNGWIKPTDPESNEFGYYLSTHTFYERNYKYNTKVLQDYGFDVELESWG